MNCNPQRLEGRQQCGMVFLLKRKPSGPSTRAEGGPDVAFLVRELLLSGIVKGN